jgi:hypothetical protein
MIYLNIRRLFMRPADRIVVTPRIISDDVEGYGVQIPLTTGAILSEIALPRAVASPNGLATEVPIGGPLPVAA